ncbi:MAG TPA: HEPN domain-containing protein [Candidatus Wunengus sp. YC63]|uniref:HEPN domain-containing protein n=1 Tax=unclassified Candidatus Wunengus TaxID=3367695 RepID=UPI0027140588|nr:HEPN domain-containing protein [Candidatus Brocadiales bacterium]
MEHPKNGLKGPRVILLLRNSRRLKIYTGKTFCFETQQAAEKVLKAVLLSKKIQFRFVHDLAELITLLENNGVSLPEGVRTAAILTDYSVEARYPGPFEPVTKEEFKKALKIAEGVVVWAEKQIANK